MHKYEMMDKIIQYQMERITTGEVAKALDDYTESVRQLLLSNFVALSKPNYKAKDGSIKQGILIGVTWYAPRNDC